MPGVQKRSAPEHEEGGSTKLGRKENSGSSAATPEPSIGQLAEHAPLPRFPADDPSGAATPARDVIGSVFPWVLHRLQAYIKQHNQIFDGVADKPVHEHQPLLIAASAKDSNLKSYKAPWNNVAAYNALATTDLYEAAGNIAWVRLFPMTKDMEIVAGADVPWSQVVEVAEEFFGDAATLATNAGGTVKRIVFPITLFVNAPEELDIASATHFSSCLHLISGHAFLYAWWFAMFKALRDDAATLVASLWQCGLTVTIHLRRGLDAKAMAAISCAQSELNKEFKKLASDSFPAFARKALLIAPSGQEARRTQTLKELGIRYNNSPVQKVCAACLFADQWRATTPP